MGSVDKEKAALISGIEKDARSEEQEILKAAEKQAAEKRDYCQKKIESILADARKEAEKQSAVVAKKILSGVELEVKRRSMHMQDLAMNEILGRVEKKLGSMIGETGYRQVLIEWIAQAAIGLGAESAMVNANEQERRMIDEKLLSDAMQKIQDQTGKKTLLKLSDEMPLKSQGVVLTAADGRIAFNNQIKTRMLRNKREIQRLIYSTLFSDD